MNVGNLDKILRAVVGVVLLWLGWASVTGAWSYVMLAAGIILVVTAATGFCPIYRLIGVNTCRRT